jgi:2-polyprenyl-3-methyl-5-hydroxy-6-metoxy-1,4-benzoquinol methylase
MVMLHVADLTAPARLGGMLGAVDGPDAPRADLIAGRHGTCDDPMEPKPTASARDGLQHHRGGRVAPRGARQGRAVDSLEVPSSSPPAVDVRSWEVQRRTQGMSPAEIGLRALELSDPEPGLHWLDIGAGTGGLVREIVRTWEPSSVTAVDVIDWLADDLRPHVEVLIGDAVAVAASLPLVDRILLVETLEHVDAPWTLLRHAARLLRPGGIVVTSTPNVTTLRHRLELAVRGQLTAFRPHELQHLTPVLPHVTESVLADEGLHEIRHVFAGRDVIPLSGGRPWSASAARFAPRLLNISVLTVAHRAP